MKLCKIYGILDDAVYIFCEFWGRKDKDGESVDGAGQNCKQTINNKHYNCRFFRENTCGHITELHPIKFTDYAVLQRKSVILPAKISSLFEKLMVDALFEKRFAIIGPKRMCQIDKGGVEGIAQ